MKLIHYLFIMFALPLPFAGRSQDDLHEFYETLARKGEVKFRFVEKDAARIAQLSHVVSIDGRKDSLYSAYANQEEFRQFLSLGYEPLRMEDAVAKAGIEMAATVEEMQDWNRYPTYGLYLEMMRNFAEKYPHICRLDTIGKSVQGRLILCLAISDSVDKEEPEPGFFYSSSIHGDELTGFVLMLRLIDHLLSHYGTDAEATRLVNEMHLYINPLSNPDGAYKRSDSSVAGATRYNANNIDLNRNYPDFWKGSAGTLQPENQAMIEYVQKHDFVMSVNIHGGSDVLNFPWDAFTSSHRKHADYDWWVAVSKRYVDTCRKVDNSAYRDVNQLGYVDGGDWYVVNHGRQDYMNAFRHVREQTLEISVTKLPASSRLPSFWNINHRALINYMKEAGYGIRGRVSDSVSGQPVRALVTVRNHDKDSSQVYSSPVHGMFFRPIAAGSYDLVFSAPGYHDKVVNAVAAADFSVTHCDVRLVPVGLPADTTEIPQDTVANRPYESFLGYRISPNPVRDLLGVQADVPFTVDAVYNVAGKQMPLSTETRGGFSNRFALSVSAYPQGLYMLQVRARNGEIRRFKFIKP